MKKQSNPVSSAAMLALGRALQRVGRRFRDPGLLAHGRKVENVAKAALKNDQQQYPNVKVLDGGLLEQKARKTGK